MNNKITTPNRGINILSILGVVFVILKLTGYITWSWWWITAPFWGGFVVVFVLVIFLYLLKDRQGANLIMPETRKEHMYQADWESENEVVHRRHKVEDCQTCKSQDENDFHPSHDASARCESGRHSHCSCDLCF